MPTLLAEFGLDPATTSTTTAVVHPTVALPVGTLVVVGLCALSAPASTRTLVDSGGNAWTKTDAFSTNDTSTSMTMWSSVLVTALTTASTLTITSSTAMSRHAVAVAAFSDGVFVPITHGTMNETTTNTPTAGSVTTTAPVTMFGMTGFVNSARVLTPGAGYTGGTKHLSTAGSGERAVQLVWRDAFTNGAYAAVGTLDTSGDNVTCLGYVAVSAPVVIGWADDTKGGTTPVSLVRATAGAIPGDLVLILTVTSVNSAVFQITNSTFVTIGGPVVAGSRAMQVLARVVDGTDPAAYAGDVGAVSATHHALLLTIRGTGFTSNADLTKLVKGTFALRATTGTSFTNVAPGLTTTDANSLVLIASGEATTVDDTVAPFISTTGLGASTVVWPDDPNIESCFWGKFVKAAIGTTPSVTITYQNTQASNGAAMQIAVPPKSLVASWKTKTAKVWDGTTWNAKPVKVWNGTAWSTAKPTKVWTP